MSSTPDTQAGRLTDRIMAAIATHIKDRDHYYPAWETVRAILTEEFRPPIGVSDMRCGFTTREGDSKRCVLPVNHKGPCDL